MDPRKLARILLRGAEAVEDEVLEAGVDYERMRSAYRFGRMRDLLTNIMIGPDHKPHLNVVWNHDIATVEQSSDGRTAFLYVVGLYADDQDNQDSQPGRLNVFVATGQDKFLYGLRWFLEHAQVPCNKQHCLVAAVRYFDKLPPPEQIVNPALAISRLIQALLKGLCASFSVWIDSKNTVNWLWPDRSMFAAVLRAGLKHVWHAAQADDLKLQLCAALCIRDDAELARALGDSIKESWLASPQSPGLGCLMLAVARYLAFESSARDMLGQQLFKLGYEMVDTNMRLTVAAVQDAFYMATLEDLRLLEQQGEGPSELEQELHLKPKDDEQRSRENLTRWWTGDMVHENLEGQTIHVWPNADRLLCYVWSVGEPLAPSVLKIVLAAFVGHCKSEFFHKYQQSMVAEYEPTFALFERLRLEPGLLEHLRKDIESDSAQRLKVFVAWEAKSTALTDAKPKPVIEIRQRIVNEASSLGTVADRLDNKILHGEMGNETGLSLQLASNLLYPGKAPELSQKERIAITQETSLNDLPAIVFKYRCTIRSVWLQPATPNMLQQVGGVYNAIYTQMACVIRGVLRNAAELGVERDMVIATMADLVLASLELSGATSKLVDAVPWRALPLFPQLQQYEQNTIVPVLELLVNTSTPIAWKLLLACALEQATRSACDAVLSPGAVNIADLGKYCIRANALASYVSLLANCAARMKPGTEELAALEANLRAALATQAAQLFEVHAKELVLHRGVRDNLVALSRSFALGAPVREALQLALRRDPATNYEQQVLLLP